jgi:hypothetical protein
MWMPCKGMPWVFFSGIVFMLFPLHFVSRFMTAEPFQIGVHGFFPVSVAVQSCYSCCFPFFLLRMIFRFQPNCFSFGLDFRGNVRMSCVGMP